MLALLSVSTVTIDIVLRKLVVYISVFHFSSNLRDVELENTCCFCLVLRLSVLFWVGDDRLFSRKHSICIPFLSVRFRASCQNVFCIF